MNLRDDVSESYTLEKAESVIEELRLESMDTNRQETTYIHGRLGCTLCVFDEAIELHFPYEDFEGTAIALDPEAATQLHSFVDECLQRIPDDHRRI